MALSRQEEKALFRFNIIFPLLNPALENGERTKMINDICSREYVIPYSSKRTLSANTIWKWYHTYIESGTIDSLAPRGRSDKGVRRAISEETRKKLLAMRNDNENIPIKTLVEKAVRNGVFAPGEDVSMSLIYDIFRQEERGYDAHQKDRRAYRAPSINDMWQSDAMHGPRVMLNDGGTVVAKLFACIDNHSRLICFAAWYKAETAECFMDCLWNAFHLRGLPKTLYWDNGSSFRDDRIRLGCASLGVNVVYAKPYSPQGKGVIERLNRTIRQQFLSQLEKDEKLSLTELNTRFSKWVDEYNRRVHSALDGISPLQCYLSQLKAVRNAPEDLPLHFRRRDTRIVNNDRTVRFKGRKLEAPRGYSGREIEIRWFDQDPYNTCEAFFNGQSIGMLSLVDLEANYYARRNGGA